MDELTKAGSGTVITVALVLAALTGCTSAATASAGDEDLIRPAASPTAGRYPSDWYANPPAKSVAQEELLIGGVDEANYRQAFLNYEACLRDAGYELVWIDKESRNEVVILGYSIPDEAIQSGAHQLCYPREFAAVDAIWQAQHLKQ